MRNDKSTNQRAHAKQRFLERHGWEITDDELDYLRGCIKKQRNATFVRRQSLRVTIWDIEYKGRTVRVVYDRVRQNIVTVLPPEGMEC